MTIRPRLGSTARRAAFWRWSRTPRALLRRLRRTAADRLFLLRARSGDSASRVRLRARPEAPSDGTEEIGRPLRVGAGDAHGTVPDPTDRSPVAHGRTGAVPGGTGEEFPPATSRTGDEDGTTAGEAPEESAPADAGGYGEGRTSEAVRLVHAALPVPALVEAPIGLSSRPDLADGPLLREPTFHVALTPTPWTGPVVAALLGHPTDDGGPAGTPLPPDGSKPVAPAGGHEAPPAPASSARPGPGGSDGGPSVPAFPTCRGSVRRVGPWWIRADAARGRVLEVPWREPHRVLDHLPALPGPPAVVFLLPHLAVGGAERLLFDLLEGPGDRMRAVLVTLEPHPRELGQTLDRARAATDHLFCLGDWLPREVHLSALLHLLRRFAARSLVSWNGSVLFYDEVERIRDAFPRLRIVHQVFAERGGWMERTHGGVLRAVDGHLAVNRATARAFADELGAPPERVHLVHHGVPLPALPDEAERRTRRREARAALGLEPDGLWVGSFLRLHPQKRPLDLVDLAARISDTPLRFLIAGGGPLEAELDREIERRAPGNVVRLPFRSDVDRLYDAVDVVLSPSSYEGLPILLLDAAARAIPLVATQVGDVPLLLADGGGIGIERPGDLASLEAAVRVFLDPDRRREAGLRGRATVEARFGIDRYRRELREVLLP